MCPGQLKKAADIENVQHCPHASIPRKPSQTLKTLLEKYRRKPPNPEMKPIQIANGPS
jgi:hypothetical protein